MTYCIGSMYTGNMKNIEAQTVFAQAIEKLTEASPPTQEDAVMRHMYTTFIMTILKDYSASGNSIAGLGGLGLEEGVALAERIIELNGDTTKLRYNFKAIATSIQQN